MNLKTVKQAKYDILNNMPTTMTLKTHLILSYDTPASEATPIFFHLRLVESISLKKDEVYFNQRKWWIWVPCYISMSASISNMGIFVLEIIMKRIKKVRN